MKRFWYLPLVLQALVGPPTERCQGLEGDARTQCEARARQENERALPPPPILEPRKERREGSFRTGQEFDSNRTFRGDEEGSPGF